MLDFLFKTKSIRKITNVINVDKSDKLKTAPNRLKKRIVAGNDIECRGSSTTIVANKVDKRELFDAIQTHFNEQLLEMGPLQ